MFLVQKIFGLEAQHVEKFIEVGELATVRNKVE